MVQKVDITSVKGQDKAPAQKDPHYKKIAKGLAIGLYKPGSGAMSWVARFRHANKYRTKAFSTLGMTYNDAVTAALKFADDVRGGKAPEREERAQTAKGVLTVRQLLTEYIEQPKMEVEKAGRYHEWAYTTGRLAKGYVFPALGDRKIVSLNQEDIENLQFELRRRVTAETVNRGLVPLRAALNYALAKGYVRSAFWKSVPLLEEAEHEDKVNTKEYFDKVDREVFLNAAPEHLANICRCMYYTGCRPSEARRLTAEDVHSDKRLKQPYLRLRTFKGNRTSGTGRKFPLTTTRLKFFQAIARDRNKDAPLFPTPKGIGWSMANLNKYHNKTRDELELEGFQTYCWRHAWITDMIQDDVRPLTVAKLAGTSLRFIQDNYTAGDDTLADQIPEI